ncbi:MAG: hypothetical protein QOD77_1394 [Thermoplasmata archaeon]|jgi:hypothetical protein|nr:hypothetical protein [Thermoplasmata archaeon]
MHPLHLALHADGAWTATCGDDELDGMAFGETPAIRATMTLWGPATPGVLRAVAA